MNNKILFLSMLLSIPINTFTGPTNPYCQIKTCINGSHTMCRFPLPVHSPQCGRVLRSGLTQVEKDEILWLHNKARTTVYSGNELRGIHGPMPKARYVNLLQWDEELEILAQKWADQCIFHRDKCRHVYRFLVGQTIGYERTIGNVEVFNVNLTIQKWYREVERFSRYNILKFSRDYAESMESENFSQMIWASTYLIGCGSLRYFDGQYNVFLLVCNYAPRGNRNGEPVYIIY